MYIQYRPTKGIYLFTLFSPSYITSRNSSGEIISNRMHYVNRSNATIRATKWMKLTGSYIFDAYNYLSGLGKDYHSHQLNASLEFMFLKDRNLHLVLSGHDLLNSGALYSTSINAAMMSQTYKPTYGRYFMLSLYYIFREKD